MQSPNDEASPTDSLRTLPMAASTIRLPRTRQSPIEALPLSQSEANLPFRRSNPSAASLFASTLSPPGSRSSSPFGRGSPARPGSGSIFGTGANRSLAEGAADNPGDPLNLILKAYVPHVAVYTSRDTEALMKDKGFDGGLWQLLRPFGERVQGKVSIRDSNGLSKTWDDFSIRFVKFGENIEHPESAVRLAANGFGSADKASQASIQAQRVLADVEAVVERHLTYAEESFMNTPHHGALTRQGLNVEATSPYYSLFLRRLLSGLPVAAHETFSHPVACVAAISSRNKSPIEELRNLYAETSQGSKQLPVWVDGQYLRYYVLVHDEEQDDITRSMQLFEQMKRHFGLHCHLLRLRSSQSAETDDDSIPLPRSEWMSAAEELAHIEKSEIEEGFEDPTMFIFDSDAMAIRTFVREMVTQSIVPNMERHVSLWNDQVASRRRGITGKFMNLSRKWAFGGSSRSTSGSASSASPSTAYDVSGFYRAEAPEAIMRKLADYAFMLRDWKLAQSTYDLLRSDFSDAKAWKHHAATNEMAAISLLIMPQSLSSKARAETIDQMLEAAFYSYNTRCGFPYGALRALTLGLELLRLRGGSSVDDAARWGLRLLESRIPGRVGDALLRERMAVCYGAKQGVGSNAWGSRRRKSAVWCVLGAQAWLAQSKHIQAQRCLNEAQKLYSTLAHGNGISKFALADELMASLQQHLSEKLDAGDDDDDDATDGDQTRTVDDELVVDEESEALDSRPRRASMMGRNTGPGAGLETAPLREDAASEDDSGDGTNQGTFG